MLPDALRRLAGVFQCDCRGIGADWRVDQLREIATALLGSVDIVAKPDDLERRLRGDDARRRWVVASPHATLRLWAPQGSEVQFVRQVAPEVLDLTSSAVQGVAAHRRGRRPARGATRAATTTSRSGCRRRPSATSGWPPGPRSSSTTRSSPRALVASRVDGRRQPDDAHRSRRRPLHRADPSRRGHPAGPGRTGRRPRRRGDHVARRGGQAGQGIGQRGDDAVVGQGGRRRRRRPRHGAPAQGRRQVRRDGARRPLDQDDAHPPGARDTDDGGRARTATSPPIPSGATRAAPSSAQRRRPHRRPDRAADPAPAPAARVRHRPAPRSSARTAVRPTRPPPSSARDAATTSRPGRPRRRRRPPRRRRRTTATAAPTGWVVVVEVDPGVVRAAR